MLTRHASTGRTSVGARTGAGYSTSSVSAFQSPVPSPIITAAVRLFSRSSVGQLPAARVVLAETPSRHVHLNHVDRKRPPPTSMPAQVETLRAAADSRDAMLRAASGSVSRKSSAGMRSTTAAPSVTPSARCVREGVRPLWLSFSQYVVGEAESCRASPILPGPELIAVFSRRPSPWPSRENRGKRPRPDRAVRFQLTKNPEGLELALRHGVIRGRVSRRLWGRGVFRHRNRRPTRALLATYSARCSTPRHRIARVSKRSSVCVRSLTAAIPWAPAIIVNARQQDVSISLRSSLDIAWSTPEVKIETSHAGPPPIHSAGSTPPVTLRTSRWRRAFPQQCRHRTPTSPAAPALSGTRPSAMRRSYLSRTPAVLSSR